MSKKLCCQLCNYHTDNAYNLKVHRNTKKHVKNAVTSISELHNGKMNESINNPKNDKLYPQQEYKLQYDFCTYYTNKMGNFNRHINYCCS